MATPQLGGVWPVKAGATDVAVGRRGDDRACAECGARDTRVARVGGGPAHKAHLHDGGGRLEPQVAQCETGEHLHAAMGSEDEVSVSDREGRLYQAGRGPGIASPQPLGHPAPGVGAHSRSLPVQSRRTLTLERPTASQRVALVTRPRRSQPSPSVSLDPPRLSHGEPITCIPLFCHLRSMASKAGTPIGEAFPTDPIPVHCTFL
eukprot:scaffold245144_cov31-Tisochrysis_lutea.AAC.2